MLTLVDDTRKEPTAEDAAFLHPVRSSEAHFGPPPQAMTPESSALSAPSSPYTNDRATIRSLTLPIKPNLDIPQSPLGSQTAGADQKFSGFLEIKKQGIHFNTKLASSSALKNPSLLPKLMDSAAVSSERQYATTLPTELWDPVGFPSWSYKEELAEAQHRLSKEKEEERVRSQRESISFVAASPGQPSGSVLPKGTKASAAERVMAGLDKNRKPSPQLDNAGVRIGVEKRKQTSDGVQAGRAKSSTRRKHSHSR